VPGASGVTGADHACAFEEEAVQFENPWCKWACMVVAAVLAKSLGEGLGGGFALKGMQGLGNFHFIGIDVLKAGTEVVRDVRCAGDMAGRERVVGMRRKEVGRLQC